MEERLKYIDPSIININITDKVKNYWVKISVLTIAISGIYSIFLVLLRAPFFSKFFSQKTIFKTALVIHVDLSVLYWLICIICIFITEKISDKYQPIILLMQKFIMLSIILICITPIITTTEPYMNNYVPVLHNLPFTLGLGIFFTAIIIISTISLFYSHSAISKSLSLIIISSFISFFISSYKIGKIPYPIDMNNFYEMIFWGIGHILQYAYTSGFIYVLYYLIIEDNNYKNSELTNNLKSIFKLDLLVWINAIFALPLPLIQLFYNIDDAFYFNIFTKNMIIFGGIIPTLSILLAFLSLIYISKKIGLEKFFYSKSEAKLRISIIILSSLTFLSGGLIALQISGTNVTIPAHYHGSIVGITIAFMGYIYVQLKNNFSSPNWKFACWQLKLYSLGQIIHITGLAYSGGYGVLRKTPYQELSGDVKMAMHIMSGGGLIAIIAGLFFVIISFNSILNSSKLLDKKA